MLCTNHNIVGNVLYFRENVFIARRLLVHRREGCRIAVEPLCSAVHKERVCRLRMIVVTEAITDDVRRQDHHSACPYVICGCIKGSVNVAVLQCRYDGSLVDEGDVDFLSQAHPECCLAQTASDGSTLLGCDECMRSKEMTLLLDRILTRERYLKLLDMSKDDGRCEQVFIL